MPLELTDLIIANDFHHASKPLAAADEFRQSGQITIESEHKGGGSNVISHK
jgi:hypothetical protein